MATNIFDKKQHLRFSRGRVKQCTGMHGAGRLVGRFFQPYGVDQGVQLALRDRSAHRKHDLIHLVHQAAKNAALPTASGHDAPSGFFFDILNAAPGLDSCRANIPIDGNGLNIVDRGDEALVAQIAQHQPFGVRTQGHQGDQFSVVNIDGQGPLGGNGHCLVHAKFVDSVYFAGQRCLGQGEVGERQSHKSEATTKKAGTSGADLFVKRSNAGQGFLAGLTTASGCLVLGGLAAVSAGECAPEASIGFGATAAV